MGRGASRPSADMYWGKITKKDCDAVDAGWHYFWARRGMSPPADYAYSGEKLLTAIKGRIQRVTKPDGNNGGKQGGA